MGDMEKTDISLIKKITAYCDKLIGFSLIGIPFVVSFSSAAVNSLIGVLIFCFLVKRIANRNISITPTPLALPFLLMIVIALFSFFNSVNIHSSIQGIVKLLKYGSLIIILPSEIKDARRFKRVVYAGILGLLVASLDGVYQLLFGVDFFRHHPYDTVIGLARLKAAFPHTNIFAGYLALFVPWALTLFLYDSRGRRRIFLGAVTAIGLFCLIFTFCRSAVFGLWLAVFLMSLIKKDRFILAFIIISVLVSPFIIPKNIRDWSKSTHSVAEFLLNKERFVLYETSFNMIRHHPVVGVGVNTYSLNYQKYKLHDTDEGTANTAWYAHNSFLQMASETGITGLLIFACLLFVLFKGWFVFNRKTRDSFRSAIGLGMIMGIVAFLINGLTETNLYYPKIAVMFWFQVSLLTVLIYPKKEAKNE